MLTCGWTCSATCILSLAEDSKLPACPPALFPKVEKCFLLLIFLEGIFRSSHLSPAGHFVSHNLLTSANDAGYDVRTVLSRVRKESFGYQQRCRTAFRATETHSIMGVNAPGFSLTGLIKAGVNAGVPLPPLHFCF